MTKAQRPFNADRLAHWAGSHRRPTAFRSSGLGRRLEAFDFWLLFGACGI